MTDRNREWGPKPSDLYVFEYILIVALIVVVSVSVWVGVSHWPAAAERAAEYELSQQEVR